MCLQPTIHPIVFYHCKLQQLHQYGKQAIGDIEVLHEGAPRTTDKVPTNSSQ